MSSKENDAMSFWLKLMGSPPLKLWEHKDAIMKKGERIVQDLFKLEEGNEVMVTARDLR
mgnify:CR=1 FL=1